MSCIPIFLASNDNYAPYVATTIVSIVSNTESYIAFYILENSISTKNKHKLAGLSKQFENLSIKFISMNNADLDRFPNIAHYSTSTFSRYFIPELKPNLHKILYLDVDIIVKGDIADLYNQDLTTYPVGAVLEDFYSGNYSHLQKICPTFKGGSNYFNAGVMLMNLDYFREHNITDKLIQTTIELQNVLGAPDQDVLNFTFDCNFKKLDYVFNYMPDHFDYLYKLHPDSAAQIRDNAIVVHYTSGKPWFNASVASELFWETAKLTPFYAQLIRTVRKKEFKESMRCRRRAIKSKIKNFFS